MSAKSKRSEITLRITNQEQPVPKNVLAWMNKTMDQFEEIRRSTEEIWIATLHTAAEIEQRAQGISVILEQLGLLDHARDISQLNAQRAEKARAALERVSKQRR